MIIEKQLLASWRSQRGRYWVDLYAEQLDGCAPAFSYIADNGGGFIGHCAPEVAIQHAARQAGFNPSRCHRTYFNADLADKLCKESHHD